MAVRNERQNVLIASELVEILELYKFEVQNSLKGIVNINDLVCLLLCIEKIFELNDFKNLVMNDLKKSGKLSENLTLFGEILSSQNFGFDLDNDSLNLSLDTSVRKEFSFPDISMKVNPGDNNAFSFNDYFKEEGFDFTKNLTFKVNTNEDSLPDSTKENLSRLILDFYINFYELTSEEVRNEKNITS